MARRDKAVVTAVFGQVEWLQELAFSPRAGLDYICFTDDPALTSRSWKVIQTKGAIPGDPARSSREIKILGHSQLESYQEVLWIDNRVRLTRDPTDIFSFLDGGYELSLPQHDHRQDLRAELQAVIHLNKDLAYRVREWERFLEFNDPTALDGPVFNGTIVLRKNTPAVRKFMQEWFNLVLRFSRRDQLSFPYVLRNSDVKFRPMPLAISGSRHHVYSPRSVLKRKNTGIEPPFKPSLLAVFLDELFARFRAVQNGLRSRFLR